MTGFNKVWEQKLQVTNPEFSCGLYHLPEQSHFTSLTLICKRGLTTSITPASPRLTMRIDLGGPGLPVSPLRLGLPEDRNFLSTFSLFLHQQGQDSARLTILPGGLDADVGNTSGGMTAELDEQTDRQSGTG